jgi:hypothetical protein
MTTTNIRKVAIPQSEVLAWLTFELREKKAIGPQDLLTDYGSEFLDEKKQFLFTVEPEPPKEGA